MVKADMNAMNVELNISQNSTNPWRIGNCAYWALMPTRYKVFCVNIGSWLWRVLQVPTYRFHSTCIIVKYGNLYALRSHSLWSRGRMFARVPPLLKTGDYIGQHLFRGRLCRSRNASQSIIVPYIYCKDKLTVILTGVKLLRCSQGTLPTREPVYNFFSPINFC